MNRFSFIIFFLLPSLLASALFAEDLANENFGGLYARSIEKVLRLEDNEIDLATAALLLSDEWNDGIYRSRYRQI